MPLALQAFGHEQILDCIVMYWIQYWINRNDGLMMALDKQLWVFTVVKVFQLKPII